MIAEFKKSIAAGMMISIGATVYLSCSNKLLGAFLFAVGLFAICALDMYLFTGKIGYIFKNRNKPNCAVIWLGNLIGCLVCTIPIRFAKPELAQIAYDMVQTKLNNNIISVIILAFFCGVLMYIAVENYKSDMNNIAKIVGVFVCVATFIICGFEHSIADMCYCIFAVNAPVMVIKSLVFILIVSAANALGAITCRYITT